MALWIFSFFIGSASHRVADALAPGKNPRDPREIVANRRVAAWKNQFLPHCNRAHGAAATRSRFAPGLDSFLVGLPGALFRFSVRAATGRNGRARRRRGSA